MLYLVPPAGFPISLIDILRIIGARFSPEKYSRLFETGIKELTGTKYCFLFNFGRTALYFTLKALMELSESSKNEVVIPAYTCFTVAAPISRLGLKIRLIDIDPLTMDFNYDKLSALDYKKILAIIPSSLFGIISDWNKLRSIAEDNDVYLVDDAAQAMGSYLDNHPAGAFGDAGIFSLDRGKPLSTYLGGIMVTNNEDIAKRVEKTAVRMEMPGPMDELFLAFRIIAYALMLSPRLYWLPDKIPFLKLGQTIFDEDFKISHLSRLQKCAGSVLFSKLHSTNAIRVENAKALCKMLSDDDRYSIPGYDPNSCPVYLRLPVLARNKLERDLAVAVLKKNGISASAMYPSTIRQIKGIEKYLADPENDFTGAQSVVIRLFTLPTHPYVGAADIDKIVNCLAKI